MRLGDKVRLIQSAAFGAGVPACIFGLLAFATGRVPVWWAIPFGLATGIATAWAVATFFGVGQIAQLAARAVHGGRHYYFEHQELRVVFDDDGAVWVRLADLRACMGGDGRVIRHYEPAEATLIEGEGRHAYLSVAGVRRYIKMVRHADKAKFTVWFERDFVAPIERRRARNLPLHSSGAGRI